MNSVSFSPVRHILQGRSSQPLPVKFQGVYEINQVGPLRFSLTDNGDEQITALFHRIINAYEKNPVNVESPPVYDADVLSVTPRDTFAFSHYDPETESEHLVGITNPHLGNVLARLLKDRGISWLARQISTRVKEEELTGRLRLDYAKLVKQAMSHISREKLKEAACAEINTPDKTPITVKWHWNPSQSSELSLSVSRTPTAADLTDWQIDILRNLRKNTQDQYTVPPWVEPNPLMGARRVLPPVTPETQKKVGFHVSPIVYPSLSRLKAPTLMTDDAVEALTPLLKIEQIQAGTLKPERAKDARYGDKIHEDGLSLRHRLETFLNGFLDTHPSKPAAENLKGFLDKLNLTRTILSMKYPVPWTRNKTIRDLYQNFCDAHPLNGHGTLEGLQFKFFQRPSGVLVLRLEAQGEYSHEAATLIGHSSKTGEKGKAGQFGEGLKVVALKLLQNYGAERVTYASRDWRASFSKGPYDKTVGPESKETAVLHIDSERVPDRLGNYLEVESKDIKLLQAILKGARFCFFPQNGHFSQPYPGVSNKNGSIQFLGLNQKGDIYLNGQRYEYVDGYRHKKHWDGGVEFLNIRLNYKLEGNRDRPEIDQYDMQELIQKFVTSLSDAQVVQGIYALKPLWNGKTDITDAIQKLYDNKLTEKQLMGGDYLANKVLATFVWAAAKRKLKVDFSADKVLALPDLYSPTPHVPSHYLDALRAKEYVIAPALFHQLGARSVGDMWAISSQKSGLKPSRKEISRVNLLKSSALVLAGGLIVPQKAFKLLQDLYPYRDQYSEIQLERMSENFALLQREDINNVPVYFYENQNTPVLGHDHENGMQLKYWLDYQHLNKDGFPMRRPYLQLERHYFQHSTFPELMLEYTQKLLELKYAYFSSTAINEVSHRLAKLSLKDLPPERGILLAFYKDIWDGMVPFNMALPPEGKSQG